MINSKDKPIFNFKNMNTNTEVATTTQTVIKPKVVVKNVISVRYPVFIMFAEYLGYVSPLLNWAEEICKGNALPEYKCRILKTDAMSIFEKMKAECPIEEIKSLYEEYYSIILDEYDNKLKALELSNADDLPF